MTCSATVAVAALGALVVTCLPASMPIPFLSATSTLRVQSAAIELTIVVHTFDLANDLKIQPPEKLLERDTLNAQASAIVEARSGSPEARRRRRHAWQPTWSAPEALPDRQSIRVRASYALRGRAGRIDVATLMFPYDPQHKTFLNVYENGAVAAQAILDKDRTTFEYFAGTRQGVWAVLQRFVPAGGAPHPYRSRPSAVSRGPAAARRHAEAVAAGRHRVYHSSQHHVVAGRAGDGDTARERHRAGYRAQHRLRRARTICSSAPAGATRARGSRLRSA